MTSNNDPIPSVKVTPGGRDLLDRLSWSKVGVAALLTNRGQAMDRRTRLLIPAAGWLALGGYAWYLYSQSGSRMHFAFIIVGLGLAIANVVRALRATE
ncbi:MAG: hypothetical protein CMJ64_19305 [Planctomycetaceae bacterium]|nr:hypothetical protein [Planctomycetaceae bacterium]